MSKRNKADKNRAKRSRREIEIFTQFKLDDFVKGLNHLSEKIREDKHYK